MGGFAVFGRLSLAVLLASGDLGSLWSWSLPLAKAQGQALGSVAPTSTDSFFPVDGGQGRACRGANATDNAPSNYVGYTSTQIPSLESCKALCVSTASCTGIKFSLIWGCQVWTRAQGIGTTVASPDWSCYRFSPFALFGGLPNQECRGANDTDKDLSNFIWFPSADASTLLSCQALCVQTSGCKGIQFDTNGCSVWTNSLGINAAVARNGATCMLFQPFMALGNGKDVACRGSDPSDYWPSYYMLFTAPQVTSLADCQAACTNASRVCQGISYSSGRCEVWTKRGGVTATAPSSGSLCLRYGVWQPVANSDSFFPIDGGTDRSCRGPGRDSSSYFTAYATHAAAYLEDCKALCVSSTGCVGIEYSSSGCNIWTKPPGITSSVWSVGSTCLVYDPFTPVAGGVDRACRGSDASDLSLAYVQTVIATSLDTCKAQCAAQPGCKGIQYGTSCDLWTRPFGIQASVASPGRTCLRYTPFAVFGGADQACRGGNASDLKGRYYRSVPAASLNACKTQCVNTPGCRALDFAANIPLCRIWIRSNGIFDTATVPGYLCLQYGSTLRGVREAGPRVGQIRWAANGTKCLAIAGSAPVNGVPVVLLPCSGPEDTSQQLKMLGDMTGQIRLALNDQKCLAAAPGDSGAPVGLQVSDCQTPPLPEMQFLLPNEGTGVIRYGAQMDKCLTASGFKVILAACPLTLDLALQFILPPGTAFAIRGTKYVAHYLPWFGGKNFGQPCAATLSCDPKQRWCNAIYGNSFYESYLGSYDISKPGVIESQLDEMKRAGLDGVWIDYQTTSWNLAIEKLIDGLKQRGMGFAIMLDTAINGTLMAATAGKVTSWTQQPHYFRHQGFPIVPIFNDVYTQFQALPVSALYLSRAEVSKPSWAADTFSWVGSDMQRLDDFYMKEHHAITAASAFRGYHDCYISKFLGYPHLDALVPTLALATWHRPDYVQLTTWNDYTEGTMLEPSWIRARDSCLDVCSSNSCPTTSQCYSSGLLDDCTKPVGAMYGPGDPACGATGNLSARAELDFVAAYITFQRAVDATLLDSTPQSPITLVSTSTNPRGTTVARPPITASKGYKRQPHTQALIFLMMCWLF